MGNLGEDSITIYPYFEIENGNLWSFDSEKEEMECRICQEEEKSVNLEVPCTCFGSVKYAHRKCVQEWWNEKGNTICEICQQIEIGELHNSVTSLDSEFERFYSKVTLRCRSVAITCTSLVVLADLIAILKLIGGTLAEHTFLFLGIRKEERVPLGTVQYCQTGVALFSLFISYAKLLFIIYFLSVAIIMHCSCIGNVYIHKWFKHRSELRPG